MGALRCEDTGSLEGTALRQIPDPVVAGPGQVVVDVKAASVDFVDTLIAVGRDQIPIPVPSTPGNNLAGVVREVGPGCNRLAVWDRMHEMAFVAAFAELAAVNEVQLRKSPEDVPYEYACLAGVPYRTAYDALATIAGLRPGEDLMILGDSGAVGSGAVAIGKALGARAIACASSPAKLEFCRKTGADEAVSYSEPRFKEALKELTGGGADVVPDMVGGECSEPALRAIADFERRRPEQAAVNRDALERMLADGRITPPITGRYRLEQAAEAMRVVAGRDKFGITILEMT